MILKHLFGECNNIYHFVRYMKTLLILSIVVCSTSVQAASIVTASHTLPPSASSWFNTGAGIGTDGIVFDNREAQTFTATTSGILDTVSFVATRLSGTTADLRVTLTNLIGGQPGVSIASGLVGVNSFAEGFLSGNPDEFTTAINFFSENIFLEAESQYAIVFSTDTTEANYRIYGDYSGYLDGTEMHFQNSGPFEPSSSADLFFEVSVNPIPEPTTLLLLGFGAMMLRRKRS